MINLGDRAVGSTLSFDFNTHKADGTPITLAGTPAVLVYKNSTTESAATGITLTVDYDSRTGMHHVVIDTSANASFFSTANDFSVVITAGTVDSISVVGTVVAKFSLDLANVANMKSTALTGRDIGASVLISSGTGTGQLDVTSGVVKANLVQILAAAITGTAANLVASFTKFFNIAVPTGTVNSLPDVVPGLASGLPVLDANLAVKADIIICQGVIGTYTNTTTFNLDAGASAVDNFYRGMMISFNIGAPAEQVRMITAYTGSTKTCTVGTLSVALVSNTTGFKIMETAANIRNTAAAAVVLTDLTTNITTKTGFSLSTAGILAIWHQACSAVVTAGSMGLEIKNAVGYTGGAVYYDDLLGAAGAVVGVNGTIGNPCSAIADAITIAVALKIKIIRIGNGCAVTLAASMANYTLIGENWTLALGGQAITNAMIIGAIVSGTSSGKGANFYNCFVGTATIDESWFFSCAFNGTLTTVASGNYLFKDCTDGLPGSTNPTFTLTASAVLGFRGWTGGINIDALASTNDFSIEGYGRVVLLVSCAAAGTVRLRGNIDLVDQVSGGFVAGGGTLLDTARFNMGTINELGNKTVLTRNANGHPLTYQVGKGNNLKTVTATYVSAGGEERADTETVA